jgi:hypothetical protein
MSTRGTSIAQSFEFRVGQTPTIVVRNPIGSVITQAAADGQVAIQATKTVTGLLLGGNGLDALEKVTVSAEQTGDTITVTVKHPKHVFGGGKAVSVELVLSVPERTQLDLQVDAGNIELRGGSGVVRASVDAGNVKAEGFTFLRASQVAVDAGNVNLNAALLEDSTLMLHVDAGTVNLQSAIAAGASLDVTVDAGTAKLHLPHDASLFLDASVDMGSIKISGWNVPMKHEIVSHKARGPLGPNPSGNLRVKVDAGTIVIAPLA